MSYFAAKTTISSTCTRLKRSMFISSHFCLRVAMTKLTSRQLCAAPQSIICRRFCCIRCHSWRIRLRIEFCHRKLRHISCALCRVIVALYYRRWKTADLAGFAEYLLDYCVGQPHFAYRKKCLELFVAINEALSKSIHHAFV